MSQIINIFRKDARHHWIEILLSQAALMAFVWNVVHGWKPQLRMFDFSFWGTVIDVLLPITWWLLIVRVVQGESLVGDRQFWTTRPYEWKKLLATKVLFILVFLNLPMLVAQVFLLVKAGFTPMPYVVGLLWMQLLLIQIPFLPMVALATVTRNIIHAVLALVAVALFMAAMVGLDELLPHSALSSFDDDLVQGLILVIACVTAIGLQYARRKTSPARMVLALGAAAMAIVASISPFVGHGERQYPLPSAGSKAPVQIALGPAEPTPVKGTPDDAEKSDEPVEIQIPMVASGLPDGSLAKVTAVLFTIEGRDSFRWDSKWQYASELLVPGRNIWREDFKLDRKIYERVKSAPVKLRVSVAVAVFHDERVMQITAGSGEFAVPNVGWCWIDPYRGNEIRCHSPLVKPAMLLVRAESGASTCPAPDNEESSNANSIAYDWEWNGDQGPAEYGLSPVESFNLYLSSHDRNSGSRDSICPGTPLRFSFPSLVQRTRVEFQASELQLKDYHKGPFQIQFSTNRTGK